MDTQEILDLISNARWEFEMAISQMNESASKKEIVELKKTLKQLYEKNLELIKKYGR